MKGNRKLYIYVQNIYAGILSETDEGYCFEYDRGYIEKKENPAVSITFPKRETPYISKVLFPFFDGLIPEGWILNVVSRNWKLNMDDRFGILGAACYECIGDVSVRTEMKI